MPQGGLVRIDLTSPTGDPVLAVTAEGRNSRLRRYLTPGLYIVETTTYREHGL